MSVMSDEIALFKKWLEVNGAKFPKIEWPSLDTTGGVRGATAIETVATNEVMIEIPGHLMMSPPAAFASDIGPLLRQNTDLLRTDLLLSVFIMSERSKGSDSFFHPFLRILPEPGTIANWHDNDLLHLQDDALHVRARGRLILVESTYNRTVVALSLRCPEDFPLEKFSFDNFKFSWFSIMARAFGKRLPWTALVPFADCLNHGNLQTKYDYDVNDNGLFRLFPSGSNSYTKGTEVFNSYGRRANDNLLLDYGFAMLDNEWDTYEVMLTLPQTAPLFDTKKEILGALGYSTSLSVNLNMKSYPLNALAFLRIVLLSEGDLDHLMKTLPTATSQHDGPETIHSVFNRSAASISRDDKRRCFNRILSVSNELEALQFLSSMLTATVSSRVTTTIQDEELLAAITLNEQCEKVASLRGENEGIEKGSGGSSFGVKEQESVSGGKEQESIYGGKVPGSVFDGKKRGNKLDVEHVVSVKGIEDHQSGGILEPEMESEERDLKEGGSDKKRTGGVEEDEKWKLQCAVTYRLTRKHIVDTNLYKLKVITKFLSDRQTEVRHGDGRPDDLHFRSLYVSEECPFVPLITEKQDSDMDKDLKPERKISADKIGFANTKDENSDVLLKTKFSSNNTLKMTNSERDSSSVKADLELYIKQVNNRNLSYQITNIP